MWLLDQAYRLFLMVFTAWAALFILLSFGSTIGPRKVCIRGATICIVAVVAAISLNSAIFSAVNASDRTVSLVSQPDQPYVSYDSNGLLEYCSFSFRADGNEGEIRHVTMPCSNVAVHGIELGSSPYAVMSYDWFDLGSASVAEIYLPVG